MKSLESFYIECIESKIRHSELKARKLETGWPCMKKIAEVGRAQAIFFEDHKDRLVREMLELNLGKNLVKICGFLTNSFAESLPGRSVHVCETGKDEKSIFDNDHFPRDFKVRGEKRGPECLNADGRASEGRFEIRFELPWSDGSLIEEDDNPFGTGI